MITIPTTVIPLSKIETNRGQINGLPKNPRFIRNEKYALLKKSIEDNPEMLSLRELLVFENAGKYVIIGGNMRYNVLKELSYPEAPCKIIPPSTPVEALKAYVIKDNAAFGDWDSDLLANEWDASQLLDWGVDLGIMPGDEDEDSPNEYSRNIDAPTYEPKEEKPKVSALYDRKKADLLISEINQSEALSPQEKEFLKLAAMRHVVFDYGKIADYYAQASPEAQALFETSALVIIDFNKAIECGFVELSKKIRDQFLTDYNKPKPQEEGGGSAS